MESLYCWCDAEKERPHIFGPNCAEWWWKNGEDIQEKLIEPVCGACGLRFDENPTCLYDTFEGLEQDSSQCDRKPVTVLECACDCGAVFPLEHRVSCAGVLCAARALGVPAAIVSPLLDSMVVQ